MRSVAAVVIPVFAGALAYTGLASGATSEPWTQSSLLLLPGMLISILVVALLFLPLWSFLVHRTRRIRRTFIGVSAAVLVAIAATLSATGLLDRADGLQTVSQMLVPGIVLIITFGMLMDTSRVRGGRRPEGK